MELLSYETILAVHIAAFVFNIALVVATDFSGLLWVIGKIERLNKTLLTLSHRLIWAGLTVSIVSGAYLFSTVPDYLLTVPAFYSKVGLVVVLVINSFFIGRHISVATTETFAETSTPERKRMFISGLVSTVGWVGVVVSAQFLGL